MKKELGKNLIALQLHCKYFLFLCVMRKVFFLSITDCPPRYGTSFIMNLWLNFFFSNNKGYFHLKCVFIIIQNKIESTMIFVTNHCTSWVELICTSVFIRTKQNNFMKTNTFNNQIKFKNNIKLLPGSVSDLPIS